jgi:putative protease
MTRTRKDFELMAPVGSFESLAAAIQGGANSVYFGIEQLNMRANSANNFTTDDLKEIVRNCNENGLKSYLTLNTVLYDHDIKLMHRIMDVAHTAGVTAVIVSDQAAINYAFSKKM